MTGSEKWLWFAGVIATGGLIYLLAPVLTPFLVAALLAYLGDPVTDKLEARDVPRTVAVVIVFLGMLLSGLILLIILIPLLQEQLNNLFVRLPQIMYWLQSGFIPMITTTIGLDAAALNLDVIRGAVLDNWRDVGNILGFVMGKVTHSGQIILIWLTYLVLVPVVTFYLLRDWDIIMARAGELIPRSHEATVIKILSECDGVLAEFLRGQLLVMFASGCVYSLGLWIMGLEFSLLIGMFAGLVSFVPYLGALIGIGTAGVIAFMQYQDFIHLVYVAMVFGLGQAIEGMVLSPLLVGDRIGLHPVAVIFAVMAGAQLFGFLGVLLALPAAAVITVLLRYFHERYLDSDFYTP